MWRGERGRHGRNHHQVRMWDVRHRTGFRLRVVNTGRVVAGVVGTFTWPW
jgi:hypothetical protein